MKKKKKKAAPPSPEGQRPAPVAPPAGDSGALERLYARLGPDGERLREWVEILQGKRPVPTEPASGG